MSCALTSDADYMGSSRDIAFGTDTQREGAPLFVQQKFTPVILNTGTLLALHDAINNYNQSLFLCLWK